MTPDQVAARYLEVTEALRALESEKDELRVQLMAVGSEATAYTVSVKESTSERIESLRAIRDKSPSLFEALHQAGAIKEVVSTRITVKLTKT
jgi:hypothetical protein